MTKYIRKALILFVACIVLFATLDFIFRELRPVAYYIGQGVVLRISVGTQRRKGSPFKEMKQK